MKKSQHGKMAHALEKEHGNRVDVLEADSAFEFGKDTEGTDRLGTEPVVREAGVVEDGLEVTGGAVPVSVSHKSSSAVKTPGDGPGGQGPEQEAIEASLVTGIRRWQL